MSDFIKSFGDVFAGPIFAAIGVGLFLFVFKMLNVDLTAMFAMIAATSPLWLPFLLFYITFERWQWFVRLKFSIENGRTTLRIRLPQEVFKSPEAMENVLNQAFYHHKPYNVFQAYLDGRHPLVNSFEIVSHGGEIRFYANVPKKKFKNIVESQLYAHYPGVEVEEELIDYSAEIKWDPDTYDMMAFHITKKEDDVLPIKTYIDLGLDKLPKEEEKLDPMAAMIEQMGKAQPHERIWVQFLMKPHRKQGLELGDLHKKGVWTEKAQKKINELMQREKPGVVDDEEAERAGAPRITPGERDLINTIERNTSKYGYETAVRLMYIADKTKGKFRSDVITGILNVFKQFDVYERQDVGVTWRTDFDYPMFADPGGARVTAYKKAELEYYKARYYLPRQVTTGKDRPKVMSVEELATMYHLPGKVIVTPGLARVDSQKQTAPANLPIGTPDFGQNS